MEKVCYRNLNRDSNIGLRSFDPGCSPLRQAPRVTCVTNNDADSVSVVGEPNSHWASGIDCVFSLAHIVSPKLSAKGKYCA